MGRGTARSAVEGLSCVSPTLRKNEAHRRLDITMEIGSRNSENSEPMIRQPPIPILVALGIVAHVMNLAVNLDHELDGGAVEIGHEGPDRMLPSKLDAFGTSPQHLPERRLRRAHLPPERAGFR